jgi:hypothetical protein
LSLSCILFLLLPRILVKIGAHGATGVMSADMLNCAKRGDVEGFRRLLAGRANGAKGAAGGDGGPDTDMLPALMMAASCGRLTTVQLILMIEPSTNLMEDTRLGTVWSRLEQHTQTGDDDALASLLKVMLLLQNATADFSRFLKPQHAHIVTQGRQLRAMLPAYLEQQHALLITDCPLLAVLQPLVTAYATPTHADMWSDWVQRL